MKRITWSKSTGAAVLIIASLNLLAFSALAAGEGWVSVQGRVTYQGAPVCAMVLINGQYRFTCSEGENFGHYAMEAPLDGSGELTVQAFVSGLAPVRQTVLAGQVDIDIDMQPADDGSKSPSVTVNSETGGSIASGWARVHGTIYLGTIPLCAMVLANGQYMFSCSDNLGTYDLTVPLDGNGQITHYVFVSGLSPYKRIFSADGSVTAGAWSGSAGFGGIAFTVAADHLSLDSITVTFVGFRCGNTTISGSFKKSGSGLTISAGGIDTEFTLDPSPTSGETLSIHGLFDDNGNTISGTYEADFNGSICTGTWSASPE